MRPDNRRIDHLQRDITCATSGKRLQDHVEDAAIGPASKLPEDRIPVAKFLRQVTPRRARPHLPKNRIKHTAMVARRSATTSDKERFEIRPLIVRHQPANHSCSPQRTALNQFTILQSITLSTAPNELKRAAAAASNIDPLGLYITVVLLAIDTFWVGAKFGPSSPRLAFA